MSNSERQTELLTQCIRHDDTGQLYVQEQKVAQIEGEERCLCRAVWLMAALTGFAVVGAGYSLILLKDLMPYQTNLIFHLFRVLGVASLISLLVYVGLWIARRARLEQERAQCRSLMQDLLAARALPRIPSKIARATPQINAP
jgi:hypothetical protein